MAFPLSLRPVPQKDDNAESLQYLITRINEERGHFRNITEESLREEISNPELDSSEGDGVIDEEEKAQDMEGRRKVIFAARAEMLKLVGVAQNEALMALDFISLLLSRDAPAQANVSMSPFLKQNVPAATLGFDKSSASQPSKADEEKAKTVSVGWNMQSLNSAADKLLSSATRLSQEMNKEARYWEQILSVSEKGWSVCRMPREGHTVGVRFGFSEAAPLFSARGFAAMRPDFEGNITLDRGLSNQAKSIRVRLSKEGQLLGTSPLASAASGSQAPLETMIRQARDSLFEEELFHEVLREARELIAYGVRIEDNTIHVPARPAPQALIDGILQPPYELSIDLVALTERFETQHSTKHVPYVESIAIALRLLLTNAYRRKFALRSQPPKPLSDEKRSQPIQNILRQLINHLQHDDYVRNLASFVTNLTQTLLSAALESTTVTARSKLPPEKQSLCRETTDMEALVEAFGSPRITTITLLLPSDITYTITITTSLAAPTYGTTFQISPPATQSQSNLTFTSFAQTRQHIILLTRQAIAQHIVQQIPGWAIEPGVCDIRKVVIAEGRLKRLSVLFDGSRLALIGGWSRERPEVFGVWGGGGKANGGVVRRIVEVVAEVDR